MGRNFRTAVPKFLENVIFQPDDQLIEKFYKQKDPETEEILKNLIRMQSPDATSFFQPDVEDAKNILGEYKDKIHGVIEKMRKGMSSEDWRDELMSLRESYRQDMADNGRLNLLLTSAKNANEFLSAVNKLDEKDKKKYLFWYGQQMKKTLENNKPFINPGVYAEPDTWKMFLSSPYAKAVGTEVITRLKRSYGNIYRVISTMTEDNRKKLMAAYKLFVENNEDILKAWQGRQSILPRYENMYFDEKTGKILWDKKGSVPYNLLNEGSYAFSTHKDIKKEQSKFNPMTAIKYKHDLDNTPNTLVTVVSPKNFAFDKYNEHEQKGVKALNNIVNSMNQNLDYGEIKSLYKDSNKANRLISVFNNIQVALADIRDKAANNYYHEYNRNYLADKQRLRAFSAALYKLAKKDKALANSQTFQQLRKAVNDTYTVFSNVNFGHVVTDSDFKKDIPEKNKIKAFNTVVGDFNFTIDGKRQVLHTTPNSVVGKKYKIGDKDFVIVSIQPTGEINSEDGIIPTKGAISVEGVVMQKMDRGVHVPYSMVLAPYTKNILEKLNNKDAVMEILNNNNIQKVTISADFFTNKANLLHNENR